MSVELSDLRDIGNDVHLYFFFNPHLTICLISFTLSAVTMVFLLNTIAPKQTVIMSEANSASDAVTELFRNADEHLQDQNTSDNEVFELHIELEGVIEQDNDE